MSRIHRLSFSTNRNWCNIIKLSVIVVIFTYMRFGQLLNESKKVNEIETIFKPEVEGDGDGDESNESRQSLAQSNNRTLVILLGGIRANEAAWRTLYENVLDPYEADLALMVPEEEKDKKSSLFQRAKYVWYYHNYDDWADAMDLINGTRWRSTHLPSFLRHAKQTILFGGIRIQGFRFSGSGMILFMIRWFLLQKLQELHHTVVAPYDRFIVTRPDHYYLCPDHSIATFDFRNNTVWVPEGEDWHGICDRFYVVSQRNLLDSLDLIPPMLMSTTTSTKTTSTENAPPFLFDENKHRNTEAFLKASWETKGLQIKRFPRTMLTCATKFDNVRWYQKNINITKKGVGTIPGVPSLIYPKHRTAYELARNTCDAVLP